MNKIRIEIKGPQGSGKTLVLNLIRENLSTIEAIILIKNVNEHEIEVDVNTENLVEYYNK